MRRSALPVADSELARLTVRFTKKAPGKCSVARRSEVALTTGGWVSTRRGCWRRGTVRMSGSRTRSGAARTGRSGPDRSDPDHPAGWRAGEPPPETAALPAATPHRSGSSARPPSVHQDRRQLTLGRPTRRSVHPLRQRPTPFLPGSQRACPSTTRETRSSGGASGFEDVSVLGAVKIVRPVGRAAS
jgi:hypothetical protein